ncbi:uncharacterized protein CLUP02_04070 [Colletotrichum lupini]|uniref:Uncharacterized protein n=1 Tax=Colletotrichum lupini TaxID=145971 RepID=A0A9Q8WCE2_9PEZI|nr:uncharacterized protein CLUP02_04070 [Colletotrichum lupini]UQC78593.1 hypothetical protein CLUP02_04070 [Colletotrichum lupini]
MSKTAHPGVGETTPQTNPPAQIHHPRRGSALIRFRWPRAVSFKGGVRKYVRKYARWLRHPILLRAFGRSATSGLLLDGSAARYTGSVKVVKLKAHRHEQGATSSESSYRGGQFIPTWDGYRSTRQQTDVTVRTGCMQKEKRKRGAASGVDPRKRLDGCYQRTIKTQSCCNNLPRLPQRVSPLTERRDPASAVRKVCRIGVAIVDSRLPGFRSPENADLRFSSPSGRLGMASALVSHDETHVQHAVSLISWFSRGEGGSSRAHLAPLWKSYWTVWEGPDLCERRSGRTEGRAAFDSRSRLIEMLSKGYLFKSGVMNLTVFERYGTQLAFFSSSSCIDISCPQWTPESCHQHETGRVPDLKQELLLDVNEQFDTSDVAVSALRLASLNNGQGQRQMEAPGIFKVFLWTFSQIRFQLSISRGHVCDELFAMKNVVDFLGRKEAESRSFLFVSHHRPALLLLHLSPFTFHLFSKFSPPRKTFTQSNNFFLSLQSSIPLLCPDLITSTPPMQLPPSPWRL